MDKKAKKKADKQCYFCGNDDYSLLDLHRIIEGKDGGEYNHYNTIVCCCLCHRKIHAGSIKIDRKYYSTKGRWVLHYWIGEEEYWE